MNSKVQVRLFGSLRKKLKDLPSDPFEMDINIPMPLDAVLDNLKIPTDMVQLAMVNYKAVPKDSVIQPSDRLSLFPKEFPFFHDWKDMRF